MIGLGAFWMEYDGWGEGVLWMVVKSLMGYLVSRLGSELVRRLRRRHLGRRHKASTQPSSSNSNQ